jgi:Ca-activated chloride channel family protein
LGLVLFGSQAYLQVPLTFDWQTVQTLMNEAQIGLAGKKTAIGDAIGLTIKRLQSHPEQSRVVILLTDGANTAGEVEPLKAAELAQQSNVKIYTIGLGADAMEVASFFGSRQVNPSRDLDEVTLQKMADITGGHYFRARDSKELEKIYDMIDQLEPTEKDPEIFRPQVNIYYWPLAFALIISFLISLQALGLFRYIVFSIKSATKQKGVQ